MRFFLLKAIFRLQPNEKKFSADGNACGFCLSQKQEENGDKTCRKHIFFVWLKPFCRQKRKAKRQ